MRRWLTALASMAVLVGVTGCNVNGPDEDGYLDATTYLDPGTEHYRDQVGRGDEALAFGYRICKALDGGAETERAYAIDMAMKGWSVKAKETTGLNWHVAQATKYLCPEHEDEDIDWYTVTHLDVVKEQVLSGPGSSWVYYGTEQVDDDTHVITRPMLRKEEKAWLAKHPTMPRLRLGSEWHQLDNDVLEDVQRLTRVRVLNAKGGPRTVSVMGADEDILPAEAEDASETHLRLVRTIPAAGEPVDIHEGITLVVRWTWKFWDGDQDGIPDKDDDTPWGVHYSSGDDDDFNVPGWLCPTRFC